MNISPAVPSTSPPGLSLRRQGAVRAAAHALGAGEDVARRLADGETVAVDGCGVGIHALGARPNGDWLALVLVLRPAGVPEGRWCDALLDANGQALLCAEWAFGLESDGSAALLMRLPPGEADPRFLAARLEGALALGRAVVAAVTQPEAAPAREGAVA
jgi:hypothetical protein